MSYWNAAVEQGKTVKDIDENLASNDDNKQIADLLLRRTDAINRRDRLIKAVENAIKVKYQPQIPEMFSAANKAMQSRLVELQHQCSSIGRVKILMSALQDENQILNYLDPDEKKRAIDKLMVNNEKLREDSIANGNDANEEDYAAACQEFLQKRSDIKTKIEALLKSGDEGAILRSLEDAEQRLADARVNSAADKFSKNGTSSQKETQPDNEQKGYDDGHIADDRREPRKRARSLQLEEMSIDSQGDKTKSNKTSVISKTSSARRVLHLELKALKEQDELQTRLTQLKQMEIADLQKELVRKAKIAEKEIQIAQASSSCGSSLRSISPVGTPDDDLTNTQKQYLPGQGRNVASNVRDDYFIRSSLPKLKLAEFSGDPLEWPEWSQLFQATVHAANIDDSV